MRTVLVIGIGPGDPEQVTVQAINAMRRADVFLLLDKGDAKRDLADDRRRILDTYLDEGTYRVVSKPDPQRDRTSPTYENAVHDWRQRRTDVFEDFIASEVADGETGAFLVWGDPALYDGTISVLDDVLARGTTEFDYTVIPGVSSVSALAATHRTTLNQVGKAVQITTGRRLADGWPDGADDVVVMLDAHNTFTTVPGDTRIYWGAYVSSEDEILIDGRVSDVAGRIETERAAARERKGWIMDTYLLRRDGPQRPSGQ